MKVLINELKIFFKATSVSTLFSLGTASALGDGASLSAATSCVTEAGGVVSNGLVDGQHEDDDKYDYLILKLTPEEIEAEIETQYVPNFNEMPPIKKTKPLQKISGYPLQPWLQKIIG